MNLKEIAVLILSLLFLVWLITPMPELTLIGMAILNWIGFKQGLNPRITLAVSIATFVITTIIMKKTSLHQKIKSNIVLVKVRICVKCGKELPKTSRSQHKCPYCQGNLITKYRLTRKS